MSPLPGHATPEGTAQRADTDQLGEGFYRDVDGLTVSTLGMGTYLGETHDDARKAYQAAARRALEAGVTLLDTASNYRHQASERDLGQALAQAGNREGALVVTKGGFVHGDVDEGLEPPRYLQELYLDTGRVQTEDVVRGMHCMAPGFLRGELTRSLENLGLEQVDLYLVHNPETQIEQGVPEREVYDRLEDAFAELERQREMGKLVGYGIATWEGLRQPPRADAHLSLGKVVEAAENAHERVDPSADVPGLAAVQLPFNMHLLEAASLASQRIDGELVPALEAIRAHELIGLTSASLMQGGLLGRVTEQAREVMGVDSDVAACLQLARSAPGVTTSLVGMGTPEHVDENVEALAGLDPDPGILERLLNGGDPGREL